MLLIKLLLVACDLLRHEAPDVADCQHHCCESKDEVVDFGLLPKATFLVECVGEGDSGRADVNVEERQWQDTVIPVDELADSDVRY